MVVISGITKIGMPSKNLVRITRPASIEAGFCASLLNGALLAKVVSRDKFVSWLRGMSQTKSELSTKPLVTSCKPSRRSSRSARAKAPTEPVSIEASA